MKPTRARPTATIGALALALLLSGCGPTGTPAPRAEYSNRPAQAVDPAPVPESLGCPAPRGHAGTTFTTFRAGVDGACIRPDRLVEYRCSARAAPVIQMGAEPGRGVRRYLGGRFGSPVDGVPPEAVFAAIGSKGASVYTDPSNPSVLYVKAGVSVRRWLRVPKWPPRYAAASDAASGAVPSPSPVGPSGGLHAYFMGDSVLLAAQLPIEAALSEWNVAFDAVVGRTTPEALTIVQGQAPYAQGAVVIHLGENDLFETDAEFAGQVQEIMRALAGAPMVVWVNLHESTTLYADFNRRLAEAVSRFPNGVVADWNAVAPADGIVSDGIHLNTVGAQAFGDLILDYLLQWQAVAEGRGPASCPSMPVLPSPTSSPLVSASSGVTASGRATPSRPAPVAVSRW
jgi:hypothetical protein